MADVETADRSERATPKRISDARKRGQVPRSMELSAAAVMLAGSSGVYFLGAALGSDLGAMMREFFAAAAAASRDEDVSVQTLRLVQQSLVSLAPLLGIVLLAALAAPLVIGGWNFSTEALQFQFERISPLAGLKRIFSMRGWIELVKSMARFAVIALIAVLLLWSCADDFVALASMPINLAIAAASWLCAEALLYLAAGLALIAAIDVPFQLWQYQRDLRMTQQEVREENKETEGSPETKGRIRSAQQTAARRRMMSEVPTADVVITNPEHFAVALRYDESRMRAPIVVAKGIDLIAARIREIATANGVAIVEAPPLARVLYRSVDLGAEIPVTLYAAVAQVLSYVLQLRIVKSSGGVAPVAPQIDPAVEHLVNSKREDP